jgi:hypothetical protein
MHAIVWLIVYVIIIGILLYFADFLLKTYPPPEPFGKFGRVVLGALGVLALVYLLLAFAGVITGGPFIVRPL